MRGRAWKSAFAKQVLPKLRIPGEWIGGREEAEDCIADEARRLARDHAVPLRRQALEERSGCKSVAPAPCGA